MVPPHGSPSVTMAAEGFWSVWKEQEEERERGRERDRESCFAAENKQGSREGRGRCPRDLSMDHNYISRTPNGVTIFFFFFNGKEPLRPDIRKLTWPAHFNR